MGVIEDHSAHIEHGRLPMARVRMGDTRSFEVDGAEFSLTANASLDGRLGEVFVKFGQDGSTVAGLLDAVSILLSLAVQAGVPLETVVEKLMNTRYEPMGRTDDPEIPAASSIVDYLARRLALDFLSPESRSALGITSATDDADQDAEPFEIPPAVFGRSTVSPGLDQRVDVLR
jgi:hypothetical protein